MDNLAYDVALLLAGAVLGLVVNEIYQRIAPSQAEQYAKLQLEKLESDLLRSNTKEATRLWAMQDKLSKEIRGLQFISNWIRWMGLPAFFIALVAAVTEERQAGWWFPLLAVSIAYPAMFFWSKFTAERKQRSLQLLRDRLQNLSGESKNSA